MSSQLTKAAAAVLVAVSALAACSSDTAESLKADARQYQQKGDNKAAAIQLKNALEKNPDDAQARFMLASLAIDMDDPLTAEKEARRALALKYPAEQVLPVLGKSLTLQAKFQEALDETAQGPRTPAISTLRGHALLGLGKTDESKREFDAALAQQPGFSDALTGQARLAALQEDWAGGLRLLDEAIAKDAANFDAWQLKGDLLRVAGKGDEAMAAYQQVLKIKPSHRTAHLEQAAIHIAAKKYDAAQADIDAARKSTPGSFLVAYHQALLDFSRGKLKEAQTNLLKVNQAASQYMPGVLLSGVVALNLGLLEQAEGSLRKYVEWNPDHLQARKMLVSTLLKSGQGREAQTILAPVLKGEAPDVTVLQMAGEAAMLSRDFSKAADYLSQAIKQEPGRAPSHTSLGLVRLAQGDRAGGIAELQKALELEPGSLQSGSVLVRTLLDLGVPDKALAAIAKMEASHSGSAELQVMKGNAYLAKQDRAKARAAFDAALASDATHFPAAAGLAQLDIAEKKPDAARKRFEALLAKDAKNIEAHTALAQLDMAQGNTAGATKWLEKANELHPDDLNTALRLGAHYNANSQPAKAQTLLRKYQAANPDNAALLDVLGQAQMANKDPAAALETFGKLTSVLPRAATPQLRLAGAQLAMKNPSGAGATLAKAVSLEPNNIQPYLAQAELAVSEGNSTHALEIVRQVQKQFPKTPVGYMLEGDLFIQQKNAAAAVRPYEQALAISNEAPALLKLAKALRESGKVKESEARVLEFTRKNPGDALAAMYLAENYIAFKRYPEARQLLEAVVQQTPNNIVALNNLAWIYQQQKDARALPTAERALKLNDANPEVLDTVGWMLVEQGSYERAVMLLKKAASTAPKAPQVHYHLAVGLFKSGDKPGARKALEQALASGPGFSEAEQAKALLRQL
ncbi:XrtA/PEP-CTERM system TPR-repeat protein PrsT [Pseudoduganella lutea]|nr:XrtA/PEP-CTERM system TPR-repeat protein PrsT [Pseudoduganella lutea]